MPTIRHCYSCPEIVLECTRNCAYVRLDSWSNYFAYPSTLPTVELESLIANCRSVDSRLNTEQRCWLGPFRPARFVNLLINFSYVSILVHSTRPGQEPKRRRKESAIHLTTPNVVNTKQYVPATSPFGTPAPQYLSQAAESSCHPAQDAYSAAVDN